MTLLKTPTRTGERTLSCLVRNYSPSSKNHSFFGRGGEGLISSTRHVTLMYVHTLTSISLQYQKHRCHPYPFTHLTSVANVILDGYPKSMAERCANLREYGASIPGCDQKLGQADRSLPRREQYMCIPGRKCVLKFDLPLRAGKPGTTQSRRTAPFRNSVEARPTVKEYGLR